jgi:hypothetical protein
VGKAKPPTDDAILAGLRKAMSGPQQLTGAKGLYEANAAGKAAAAEAVNRGYLRIETKTIPAKKKDAKDKVEQLAVLTEQGRQWLAGKDDPKAILESLSPTLDRLSGRTPADPETFKVELDKATVAWTKMVADGLAAIQSKFDSALGKFKQTVLSVLPTAEPSADPKPVLDTLKQALERIRNAPTAVTLPPPSPSPQAEQLEQDIVAVVDQHGRENGRGIQFDELMEQVRLKHPAITVGRFHDALRALNNAAPKRIVLSGWTASTDDIPKHELAFYISDKVMYYANPANWHG